MTKPGSKVSYILLAFNQSRYIEAAVKSALGQNYSNIEFIFSDDCSYDGTWEKLKKLTKNSKRSVILNQMPKNSGLVEHLNFCLSICSGDIIVLAAGDDIAIFDRVSKSVKCLEKNPKAFSVTFNDIWIDSDGNSLCKPNKPSASGYFDLNRALDTVENSFTGASRAMRREVYDVFGPLQKECTTEDTPFFLRALYLGGCILCNDAGILYRRTNNSLSSKKGMKMQAPVYIKQQYLNDFDVAKRLGLLTLSEEKKVQSWIAFKIFQKMYSQQISFLKKLELISLKLVFNKFLRSYLLKRVFLPQRFN